MNKLSESIEQATQECIDTGSGKVEVDDNIKIYAEWEEYENNYNYDVVTIHIVENGICKFKYQLKETKTESETEIIPQF